ncbi:MAG: hypothetical protein AAF944_07765 [Bacteroidota bacterium]
MNTVIWWRLSLSLMVISCHDSAEPQLPLSFHYATLNEQGQPTTTFSPGENIVLSMEIVNPSDRDYFSFSVR